MGELINDYFEIVEKYGTKELKAAASRILFECGKSYSPMKMDDFAKQCIACGGNWAAMLYSGMKELFPLVYDLIPETPVDNGTANFCLASTLLRLCGVTD